MRTIFFLLSLVFFSLPAAAAEHYGLAMVGAPKYGPEDTHLDYARPDAPKGGTLKEAAIGTFDTLNPFSIKGKAANGLELTTDRLMARVWDEPFTMYPLIAEKVEVPEDRSSITFFLNPRARFHDGSAITSDDVLFSFETLREQGRPNMRRIYALASAQKIDDRTVKFSFSKGYDRETVMIFALMPVLSKTWWTGKTFDATMLDPPLSSGPYKISDIDAGRKIAYERVKDYWAADLLPRKGHNNFDRIEYEYYRDNSVAFESFKTGDLNFRREWDAGIWNSAYDFPAATNEQVKRERLKHGRPDRVRGFIFNTRRPPFDDIRVREALGLLFDFDWVNKTLYHGEYKRIDSFFPNTDLAAAPQEQKEITDRRTLMRLADQKLKDAGWVVENGKRIHEKSKKSFEFEILLDDPSQEKLALALVRNLERMGISPRVRVLDSAAFRGRLNEYNFDMILYYWLSTLSPGTEQYLYWSCESANQPSRWNYAGICDPEIDRLAKTIPTARTRAELVENVRALDAALMAGNYMIPLYYNPQDYVAYWPPVQRPDKTPLYGITVETWWMDRGITPKQD